MVGFLFIYLFLVLRTFLVALFIKRTSTPYDREFYCIILYLELNAQTQILRMES